ncbi:MAG: sigma factor-like helix-turn-helix DNA-binding protein [Sediminicola sp.]
MEEIHKILTTYAYNIIGSMDDAKDVVQDVVEKYIELDKAHITNERNYLIKSTINHAINLKKKKSYQAQFGKWLPEPVAFNATDTEIIKEQTASYTLLVLMERLNALERAVFILREGFAYRHHEIAEVLDIQADHSRQLFLRAKKALQKTSFKNKISDTALLESYITAITQADIQKLESLLIKDVGLMADGGDSVKVVSGCTMGAVQTALVLQNVYGTYLWDKQFFITAMNHQPAIVFYTDQVVHNCQILAVANDRIRAFYSIVDPQKLKTIKIP